MGQILTSPVELTRVQRAGSRSFRSGVADMQGWRLHHEDAHEMVCGEGHGTFWVLDGHGGDGASIFCAPDLAERHRGFLAETPRELPDDERICKAFEDVDRKYLEHTTRRPDQSAGSTVVGAVVTQKEDGTYSVKIMNAGDSRAMVIDSPESTRAGSGIRVSWPEHATEGRPRWPLLVESVDHKPNRDIEKARIMKAGGTVSLDEPPRLDGNLAVSRGVGDFEYKDMGLPVGERKVSCVPEIYEVHGLPAGSIVILACDGLWDVMSNAEVAQEVRDKLKEQPKADLGALCAQLVRRALQENSRDNVTCMIVQLSDGSEWSQSSARFNDSDEMMFFDKLVLEGDKGLDSDSKKHWHAFLKKCEFPMLPVQCAVSGRWHRSMWTCPGTGEVYMSRHCQKKGWASKQNGQNGKEEEEESW